MNWINKIDHIVCLNLLNRTDRLIDFTEQMEKYDIPFERINAVKDKEQGARGLRDTMVNLFNEEIAKGSSHVLVFEDDAEIVVAPIWFHEHMDRIMEQIPDNYHMILLGCQLTDKINGFYTTNLIRVVKAFSTQSVLYSLQGMKEIVSRGIGYPIDNWMVDNIQNLGHTYCTYPLLCSQRPGHSDIGNNFIDWRPFMDHRYQQKINEYNSLHGRR